MLQKISWTVSLFWCEVIIDKICAVLFYFTTLHRFHEEPRRPLKYIHISEQQQEYWHAAVRLRATLSVKVGVTSELLNPSSEWQSADGRQKRGAKCINMFSFGKILRKRDKETPTVGYQNPLLFDPEGAEVLILASAAFRICICTEVSFTRRGKQCGGGRVAVRAQGWSSGERAVLQTRWCLAVHEGQHNGECSTTKRGVYLNR